MVLLFNLSIQYQAKTIFPLEDALIPIFSFEYLYLDPRLKAMETKFPLGLVSFLLYYNLN